MPLITESNPVGRAGHSAPIEFQDTSYTKSTLKVRLKTVQFDLNQEVDLLSMKLCALAQNKHQAKNEIRVNYLVDHPMASRVPEEEFVTSELEELDRELGALFLQRTRTQRDITKIIPHIIACNSICPNLDVIDQL